MWSPLSGRKICRPPLAVKARKHDEIRALAESKLNTITEHISGALMDGRISDEEFFYTFFLFMSPLGHHTAVITLLCLLPDSAMCYDCIMFTFCLMLLFTSCFTLKTTNISHSCISLLACSDWCNIYSYNRM